MACSGLSRLEVLATISTAAIITTLFRYASRRELRGQHWYENFRVSPGGLPRSKWQVPCWMPTDSTPSITTRGAARAHATEEHKNFSRAIGAFWLAVIRPRLAASPTPTERARRSCSPRIQLGKSQHFGGGSTERLVDPCSW